MKKNLKKTNRGMTILFTMLVSAAVLAIAIGVANVALQETVLSASAKEGNVAFFAADTGAECAFYWDINKDVFKTAGTPSISCGGTTQNVSVAGSPLQAVFNLDLNQGANCAKIKLSKDVPNMGETQIESLGYNVPCGSISNQNPRIVERAIRATY